MAVRFWERKAILAKIEAVYGTDPTPTGAANAILAVNLSLEPLAGRDLDRGLDQPYLGGQGQVVVDEHLVIEFEVEIAGAGAAGDAPKYGPLLRACGMAEVLTALTDAVYSPVSTAFESVTIYINIDGVLHKGTGCRGNVALAMKASDIPRYKFTLMGLFNTVADGALPTPDVSAFQKVLPVNDANTTFSLHAYSAVLEDLQLDLGQKVEGRFLVNSESIIISDRSSAGTCVIEAGLVATKDWFGISKAKTRAAMQAVHGLVAGNIVQIDAPAVEIGRPTYGQTQGITNHTLPLMLIPTAAGNDELTITVK